MYKRFTALFPGIMRRLPVYTLVFGLPVLFRFLFRAVLPLPLLLIPAAVKMVSTELSLLDQHTILKYTGKVLSALFSILFAVILLTAIVITPFSAYVTFSQMLKQGAPEELYAANLFVLLITFFTLIFSGMILKTRSYKPLPGLICLLCGIFLIIFQNALLFILFLICLSAYLVIMLKMRAAYLGAAIAGCFCLALLFYFTKPEQGGSAFVNQVLYPGIRQAVNHSFPQFPLLMDIPGYGLGYGQSRLGGSTLLTSTPVLEITADKKETIYLQTDSFDIYTGKSWEQSRLEKKTWESAAKEEWLKINSPAGVLDIRILTESFYAVPVTGDTAAFQYNNQLFPVDKTLHWQGIKSENMLPKNTIIRLYRKAAEPADPEDTEKYLQVPDFLPAPVATLAHKLAAGAGTPQEILERIQEYLSENYTYNLQAPVVREKEDFVAKFLFDDKRGYCTHFASAFVLLARLNRIPARYVTGYLVYITDEKLPKIITARSAHAWPEIRLPGQDWITREATIAVNFDFYRRFALELPEQGYLYQYLLEGNGIARNALTLRQLQELLGIKIKFGAGKQKTSAEKIIIRPEFLYRLTVLLFLLGLAAAGSLAIRNLLFLSPRKKAGRSIKQLIKTFKAIPLPEQTGWVAWQRNLCRQYAVNNEQAAKLLDTILMIAYSGRPASNTELAVLKKFKKFQGKNSKH